MRGRRAFVRLGACALLACAGWARAAPSPEVEGWGRARAVAGDLVQARAQALVQARRDAVGRALVLVVGTGEGRRGGPPPALPSIDEGRYVRALRVLEEQQLGDELVLRVAVVCDLERLRREVVAVPSSAVAAPGPPPTQLGVFAEVEGAGAGPQREGLSRWLRLAALEALRQRGLAAEALPGASWVVAQRGARRRGLTPTLRLRVRLAPPRGRLPGLEWPLVLVSARVLVYRSGPGGAEELAQRATAWGAAATVVGAQEDAALAAARQALGPVLAETVARGQGARRVEGAAVLHLRALATLSAYERLCANLRQQAVGLTRCEVERVRAEAAQVAVEPAPAGPLLAALLAASELGDWIVRVDDVQQRELWATLLRRAPSLPGAP